MEKSGEFIKLWTMWEEEKTVTESIDTISGDSVWIRKLQCPSSIYEDWMKKISRTGILELFWQNISDSAFPLIEANIIRKNILLYKLKHELSDSEIASIKNLSQLRSKSNTLKHQILALEKEYEDQDHIVRQKIQRLKDIKNKYSMMNIKKNLLKLKYSETNKQLKDCADMKQVCRYLMPNTSKDINQQKLKENLDVVASLRSTANKKEVRKKISNSLGNIDTYTLWSHLYQALSQDLDTLMELETKNDISTLNTTGENIDIGIARACGKHIYMMSKCKLSNIKANKYQKCIMEFINLIESLSHEDISAWLFLVLEIKKLETEQACLQNEAQKLKDDIQDNSLLHSNITQLTIDIKTVDAQIDEYTKNIQQSITVLNSAATLILGIKAKLHCESQKIAALQTDEYDPKWLNNALDAELDLFYNVLDFNALRKIMLKGDVGLYRHVICGFNNASVATINPQYSRIKLHFPLICTPIYSLIECYKNIYANIIYKKLYYSEPMKEPIQCMDRSVPSQKKYNSAILELLNLSKLTHNQTLEEIDGFNAILNAWTSQNVQEAMELNETTVDGVSFKDWLQRYDILLYMIQNAK